MLTRVNEKRDVILTGNRVPDNWEFKSGVEEATKKKWDIIVYVINEYDGIKKYTRYLTYFIRPFGLFLKRNHYGRIISWEQFLALMFAFYEWLFRIKRYPELTVMGFIYKPKKGLIGQVFRWFVCITANSVYVKELIVYSSSEIPYYSSLLGIPKEKFSAEVLGQEDRSKEIQNSAVQVPEKYYIAAGRSNRDYDFLRRSWPKDAPNLYIVCDVDSSEDTSNIKILKNCHGDEYLRLLAGCYVSIVPLKSEYFSSGQLVFLQSAMFGKPVITTPNNTVSDYLENGVSGLIIEKSSEALKEALQYLDGAEIYRHMSEAARKEYVNRFSLLEMGRRLGERMNM